MEYSDFTITCLGTGARTGANEYGKLISSFPKMKGIYIPTKQLQILYQILQYVVDLMFEL